MQYIGFRKHRGLRRYYKSLEKIDEWELSNFVFDNPKPWRESHHCHFDIRGYGNKSFKRRKHHLNKLFNHFDLFAKKSRHTNTPFQLYAVLLNHHSGSDALFFHMPSNNNEQFPFSVTDLQSGSTLTNNDLNNYVDKLVGYKKMYGIAGEPFCLIFKENVGQPF